MKNYLSPNTQMLLLTQTDGVLSSIAGGASGGGTEQERARAPKRISVVYS